MIVLAVTFVVKAGHEDEALRCLAALAENTRTEPGNRAYQTHRAQDDPRTFFIYETYDDEAALEQHRSSPYFERYGKNGLQAIAERRDARLYVPLGAA